MPRVRIRRRGSAAVVAAAALFVTASSLRAQVSYTVTWDDGAAPDHNWVNASNWSTDTVPGIADLAAINGSPTNSSATLGGSDVATASILDLGSAAGSEGHLNISGGTMNLGEMRVGGRDTGTADANAGGTGTVVQTAGNVNVNSTAGSGVQSLYIGDSDYTATAAADATANGSYTISGGSLISGIASDDSIVIGTGRGTHGTFSQSGSSTVTSTGFVTVARGGAIATYTMTGGTLNVGSGAVASSQTLRIGDGEYPSTVYSNTTNGTFTQSGGTITVQGDMSVGRLSGTGTYSITGSTSALNANNTLEVGRGATGTVTQGTDGLGAVGPTVKIGTVNTGTQGLSVGRSFTSGQVSNGSYTLYSGTLQIGNGSADYLAIGDGIEGYGTFTMKPGTTLTTTDLIQLGRQNSDKDNRFNMDGGTVSAGRIFIGGNNSGKGTITIKAGSITNSLASNLGIGNAGANGTVDMQGGTWTMTGISGTNAVFAVGNGATCFGTVTISGGTLSVETSVGVVDVGRGGATGSFTLSGTGELKTTLLRAPTRTAGSATIQFKDNSKSTITTLTLDNGTMTVDGGTHNITTANINAAGALTLNQTQAFGTLNVAGGSVVVGQNQNRVLKPAALTISAGSIDLKDNKIVTQVAAGDTGASYGGVAGMVKAGRNGGLWNGIGIVTSQTLAAAAHPVTNIAVATASNVGYGGTKTFGGQSVAASDTLVMYTYNGDADMNGKVNADDYFVLDSNYNKSGTVFGWNKGDFNYDGVINADDLFAIDTGFAGQGAPIGAAGPANGLTAVPEPACTAFLATATALLIRRRRQA